MTTRPLRIGTWNTAGRWGESHHGFLEAMDCDVLLLTEVRHQVELTGYGGHRSAADMAVRRSWAAVFSRAPLTPRPDPHAASAMATVEGVTLCSSILPWKGAGRLPPWVGVNHAARTAATVADIAGSLPRGAVWGGDFNHAMLGPERAGGMAGRLEIQALLARLKLHAPTASLGHRIPGLLSIDHIAVPLGWPVSSAVRIDATGLSDHDAYVVDVGRLIGSDL